MWPKLLRLTNAQIQIKNGKILDKVHDHIPDKVYHQILNDVTRSSGHLPPDSTEADIELFHSELTKIICWVLHRHPQMK